MDKLNVCSADAIRSCSGCGMCSAVCPLGAILMKENEEGFYTPVIDVQKCTGCSLCRKVCYRFDGEFAPEQDPDYECFSAVNKDEKELAGASSGAVSIELMRECIRQGYYVVGVAYDMEQNRAVTRIARTEGELEQFKGSKYFQSYTADAFREAANDRSAQKYAIFATPCQIYAFSKLADLKKNREKYMLVDIFCHGCPSLKLWDKYLEYVREKHGAEPFDGIRFRSKTHGWHELGVDFIRGERKFASSKYADPFHEIFLGMDAHNRTCYDCIAKCAPVKADIRMGDFWGRRHNTDTKGVSAVIISSQRGKRLFEAVASGFHIEAADYQEILAAQSCDKVHNCNERRRGLVFEMLATDADIMAIVKKRRRMLPLTVNGKRIMKALLKHLPQKLYVRLKNIV